jgi:cytochrome b pre-mRNA-processing protein 3
LYGASVEAARAPWFFLACRVPDTLDGRFDLITLHVVLLLRRLNREHVRTSALAQEVFDAMFADLDRALREMGAADLGVGKRVKRMVEGFYGRAAAYERALAGGEGELEEALRRNVFGTTSVGAEEPVLLALHVRRVVAALEAQDVDDLMAGKVHFPPAAG